MKFDDVSNKVIGCALNVHRTLGPGLLESTYEKCLCYELSKVCLPFEYQKELPVKYKEVDIDCGYRIDILVEGTLIIELKSVENLQRIHEAQLMTYMKLSNIGLGLVINFNSVLLRDGIRRLVL
ncbi:MAG: GxxExxY protein [Pontiella sp.]